MSDPIRNLLSDGRRQLGERIIEHKQQLKYLKASLVLASKMGEDTKEATAMMKTLQGLLDVMEKQLKSETK